MTGIMSLPKCRYMGASALSIASSPAAQTLSDIETAMQKLSLTGKLNVDPKPSELATYAHQLARYVHVLSAKRGAIVYMTTGEIQWVESAHVSVI